jgi:hypothetical protein
MKKLTLTMGSWDNCGPFRYDIETGIVSKLNTANSDITYVWEEGELDTIQKWLSRILPYLTISEVDHTGEPWFCEGKKFFSTTSKELFSLREFYENWKSKNE